ncbi:hypothetical protein EJB05_21440, partial [Eragrostis curvula]
MRPSLAARVLAVPAIIVFLALSNVDATVVTTCKAAAESDKRVDYNFCVLELSKHQDSPDADTWGLAKVATEAGGGDAGNAVADVNTLLNKAGTDAKTRGALLQCQKLYHDVEFAFAGAYDSLNDRNYAGGKQEVGLATSLAHKCDDAFAKIAVPSQLTKYSLYTMKIAAICTAITNLIKLLPSADNNTLVSYYFCVSELSKYNGSDDADTWVLAKLAAKAGAGKEANAEFELCQKMYGDVGSTFLHARDNINHRKYAAGKEQVMLGVYLTQKM